MRPSSPSPERSSNGNCALSQYSAATGMTSLSTNSRTRSLTCFSSSESRLPASMRSTGRFSPCVLSDVTAIRFPPCSDSGHHPAPPREEHRFWRRSGQYKSDGFHATNLPLIPDPLECSHVASKCRVHLLL